MGKQKTVIRTKDMHRLDEAAAEIVSGINALILKAQIGQLTTVTTILKDARESIAWWAVHDDYNEAGAEKIVHQLTLDSGLHVALNFLAKFAMIKDELIRDELLKTMKQFQLNHLLPSKVTQDT